MRGQAARVALLQTEQARWRSAEQQLYQQSQQIVSEQVGLWTKRVASIDEHRRSVEDELRSTVLETETLFSLNV